MKFIYIKISSDHFLSLKTSNNPPIEEHFRDCDVGELVILKCDGDKITEFQLSGSADDDRWENLVDENIVKFGD